MLPFDRQRFRGLGLKTVGRYAAVGTTTAILYFGLAWVLASKAGMSEVVATSGAFGIAIGWNYLMHYHWTFTSDRHHSVAISRFCVMSILGFSLNYAVISAGTAMLSVNGFFVQLMAGGLVILSNLIISALWVFGSGAQARR